MVRTLTGTVYHRRPEERETVFNCDDDERMWHAWSCIPRDIRKLKERGWRLIREDDEGAEFIAPLHALKISKAEKLQMSEAEKAARLARLTAKTAIT